LGGSRGRDIFFEWKDISVSRTIARFGATSYQISNISLVRLRYEKKFNPIAVVLFLIGAAILTVAIGRPEDLPPGSDRAIALVGAALVALAVIVQVFWPKKEFTFSLKTSSGDAESLVTQDRQFAGFEASARRRVCNAPLTSEAMAFLIELPK
jgi:O-antigen/teichoic acid export membrane protein